MLVGAGLGDQGLHGGIRHDDATATAARAGVQRGRSRWAEQRTLSRRVPNGYAAVVGTRSAVMLRVAVAAVVAAGRRPGRVASRRVGPLRRRGVLPLVVDEVAAGRTGEAVAVIFLVADLAELADAQTLLAPAQVRVNVARRARPEWRRGSERQKRPHR